MTYNYNGKKFNVPDDAIDKIMQTYDDISIADACELWLDDNEKIKNAEAEKMTAEAKKITRTVHKARSDEKKERKPREKKENPLKKQIISAIFEGIKGIEGKIEVENDEKYINLWVEGRSFTINLVEHREKKEKKA